MTSLNIISTDPRSRMGAALAALVAIAVAATVLFAGGDYLITVLGFAAIYGIFCTGLNFFMGYTGQASFGQNAFAALGGYGTAILCANHGWEPLLALLTSMIVAGTVALAVGYPTLRLRGPYFALAMLSASAVMQNLTIIFSVYTGGQDGLNGLAPIPRGLTQLERGGLPYWVVPA